MENKNCSVCHYDLTDYYYKVSVRLLNKEDKEENSNEYILCTDCAEVTNSFCRDLS